MTAIIEQIGRSGLRVVHASRATLTFAFHILAKNV